MDVRDSTSRRSASHARRRTTLDSASSPSVCSARRVPRRAGGCCMLSMTPPRRSMPPSAHARGTTLAEDGFAMRMATEIKRWTLEELHSLPDDGNKYELIHGELFVTPAPSNDHETVLARLSELLFPYVRANKLGLVYHPRA